MEPVIETHIIPIAIEKAVVELNSIILYSVPIRISIELIGIAL